MLKSTIFAQVLIASTFLTACATDEGDDIEIEESCEDDDKCDGQTPEGFETFKGDDGKYYFHLIARNGEIVMRSQGYTTKTNAVKGVESVRTNGVSAAKYKVLEASNGEFYVNLYAANNQVIATTETYTRKYSAQRARDGIRELVAEAQRIRAARSGARFQTFSGSDLQTYFHLRGKNGEVMLTSEGYVTNGGALNAIASIREHGKVSSNYKVLQARDGQWFFQLRAGNNEIIGRGETYASKSNAERAVSTLVALLQSELVADPRRTTPPTRSITQHPELGQALVGLSQVAQGGESLAHFSAAEQVQRPAGVMCGSATAAQALDAYDSIVDQVKSGGDLSAAPSLTQAVMTQSRDQLVQLLGSDSFQICESDVSGDDTSTVQTFILSQAASGPRLVLELGYED